GRRSNREIAADGERAVASVRVGDLEDSQTRMDVGLVSTVVGDVRGERARRKVEVDESGHVVGAVSVGCTGCIECLPRTTAGDVLRLTRVRSKRSATGKR